MVCEEAKLSVESWRDHTPNTETRVSTSGANMARPCKETTVPLIGDPSSEADKLGGGTTLGEIM